MGFRFRKSINLGGIRINLSKSGIGYSLGGAGFRYTKLANGRTRNTFSIPGTGISWVDETSDFNANPIKYNSDSNILNVTDLPTSNVEKVTAIEFNNDSCNIYINELLKKIRTYKTVNQIMNYLIASLFIILILLKQDIEIGFLGTIVTFILFSILKNKFFLIQTEYCIENENDFYVSYKKLFDKLFSIDKLYIIRQKASLYSRKYLGGTTGMDLQKTIIEKQHPSYLKTNIDCFCFKYDDNFIYFLPDIIIIECKNNIKIVSLKDIVIKFEEIKFVETEELSNDTEIVDYTWKYINQNGSPDKRYKYNPKFPVCKYGKITLKHEEDINIEIMASGIDKLNEAKIYYDNFSKYLSL